MYAKASDRGPDACPAVRGSVVWPCRIVFLLLTVAFAAGLRAAGWVQYLPFAATLVLFDLRHGAVDHLVPSRLGGLDGMGGRSRALLLLLRGGPMLVPLLFFPNAYSGVAADAVGLFGADAGVLCGIVSPAPGSWPGPRWRRSPCSFCSVRPVISQGYTGPCSRSRWRPCCCWRSSRSCRRF